MHNAVAPGEAGPPLRRLLLEVRVHNAGRANNDAQHVHHPRVRLPGQRRFAPKVRAGERLLERLGLSARLVEPGSTGYMTSVEQRMNIYHLVSQVLAYGVPGDLIEVGTFTGQTATLIARVVAEEGQGQKVHVYDSFGAAWNDPDPPARPRAQLPGPPGVPLPEIHQGLFEATLPSQLPEKIAFANLDVGFGGGEERAEVHAALLVQVLGHVYARNMPARGDRLAHRLLGSGAALDTRFTRTGA